MPYPGSNHIWVKDYSMLQLERALQKLSAWISEYHKDLPWDHLSTACTQTRLLYHCYADDTQVYIAIIPKETDISTWMNAKIFKFKQEKTELIIFNPKYEYMKSDKTKCVAESVKNLTHL